MKPIILLISLLFSGMAFAQDQEILDTIYANESTNVSLFFPSQISQGITGAANFIFGYNKDKGQYFGLLKAVPGDYSNLLVLTTDGQIYSYILKYQEDLPRLNYFIKIEESIGNELPKTKDTVKTLQSDLSIKQVQNDQVEKLKIEKRAAYYYRVSTGKIKTKRNKGLFLRVKDIFYHQKNTFFVFEFKNQSRIDFQMKYLRVFVTQGHRRKNSSFQKLMMIPVHRYRFPEIIKCDQKNTFVVVFPKFTIGKHGKIEVEVREKQGSRFLRMNFK